MQRVISIADPGFVATQNFDAAPLVSAVSVGSAAERAGLSVGDTILEINGQKLNDSVARHLAALLPGETLHLRVRNSAGERELQWTLDTRQEIEFRADRSGQSHARAEGPPRGVAKGRSPSVGETRP